MEACFVERKTANEGINNERGGPMGSLSEMGKCRDTGRRGKKGGKETRR